MAMRRTTTRLTEDQVRTKAGDVLGLAAAPDARAGVGQLTTFNQLGFGGVQDKPDGWYLPSDKSSAALVLETKKEGGELNEKDVAQLMRYVAIARGQYREVVGLIYNGNEVRCYLNDESVDVPRELQPKDFYLALFRRQSVDKNRIYTLTAKINNCLHAEFGIKNLYHRMIFTACALVAKRYGAFDAFTQRGIDYSTFHHTIHSTLGKELIKHKSQNQKLDLLLEVYSEIRMNLNVNSEDEKEQDHVKDLIWEFIEWVSEISNCVNSNEWNGEDVMGIFFNEFNRYKKKSESGQVFTPDHITSLIYRMLDVSQNDVVLDAACGSGAFLAKAMSNMIQEAGGPGTEQAKRIKSSQLYGIEFDREIFALACANMLIHNDGKTNITQMDARTDAARDWIGAKPVTKVLMNPPFENKYGCLEIVRNVLDSVKRDTMCAFILPDRKLDKSGKKAWDILKAHRLEQIIKLPENLFFGVGVTTSIFVFRAGAPQGGRKIFGMYLEDDGLETVKNQGRHDIRGRWRNIEDATIEAIRERDGLWIDPQDGLLSYPTPKKPFALTAEDFRKVALDYAMARRGVEYGTFTEGLLENVLYASDVADEKDLIAVTIRKRAGQ